MKIDKSIRSMVEYGFVYFSALSAGKFRKLSGKGIF